MRNAKATNVVARTMLDEMVAADMFWSGIKKHDVDRWHAARNIVSFDKLSARVLRWRLQHLDVNLKQPRLIVKANLPNLLSLKVLSLHQKSFVWRLATRSLYGMRSNCPACAATDAPNEHAVTDCDRAIEVFNRLHVWFHHQAKTPTPRAHHRYMPGELWAFNLNGLVSSAHDMSLLLLFVIAKMALYSDTLAVLSGQASVVKSFNRIVHETKLAFQSQTRNAVKLDMEQHRPLAYTNKRWYSSIKPNNINIEEGIPSLISLQFRLNTLI